MLILGVALLGPASAVWAQLLPPNQAGVSMGQWHTVVRNIDATKKFWMLLGGAPIRVDGVDVIKFRGVLVFLTQGSPAGDNGNKGCALDHPGFTMKNGEEFLGKLKAQGFMVEPIQGRGAESGYISTPDGLRIEMQGRPDDLAKRSLLGYSGKDLDLEIADDHLHYFLPESAVPDAQAWYGKLFGAKPLRENNRGNTPAGDLPGIRLRFGASQSATDLLPTKGRAMDYIGFEVKNLDAFAKKLAAGGVKVDEPYSKSRHKGFASATITDPWEPRSS